MNKTGEQQNIDNNRHTVEMRMKKKPRIRPIF